MFGSIQVSGRHLAQAEVQDLCESLQNDYVKHVSLRQCVTSDQCFKRLTIALAGNRSLLQLSLSLGLINSYERVVQLTRALYRNRPLKRLFIHGSSLGATGGEMLLTAIKSHPNLVELDMGDCGLVDASVAHLVQLLKNNGAKRGLEKLTLSNNPDITMKAWTKFFMALCTCDHLHDLSIDYNSIGDEGARLLCVSLINNKTLKVLDLEGTGLTEESGQLFLHMIQNYPVSLEKTVLLENDINPDTVRSIHLALKEYAEHRQKHDHKEKPPAVNGATFTTDKTDKLQSYPVQEGTSNLLLSPAQDSGPSIPQTSPAQDSGPSNPQTSSAQDSGTDGYHNQEGQQAKKQKHRMFRRHKKDKTKTETSSGARDLVTSV